MTTSVKPIRPRAPFGARIFAATLLGALAAWVAWMAAVTLEDWSGINGSWLLFWLGACAVSNLLPIPVGPNVQITMSSPVNIAIAFLFPPPLAAVLVGLGSLTEWEVRGETSLVPAIFNRTQLAVATGAASALLESSRAGGLHWANILAAIAAYHLMNVTLVATFRRLSGGPPILDGIHAILSPLRTFVAAYLTLGILGVTLALAHRNIGWWAVAPLLLPLLSARYGLRHLKQLEQAERERRALSDRLIDERERERARIASQIHDGVLQDLAAVQLEADNIASAIEVGDMTIGSVLAERVKARVVDAIGGLRGAVADLRRAGLEEDLASTLERYTRSFAGETEIDVRLTADRAKLSDVPLPLALLLYECCQEALTNVAKHAFATRVEVAVARVGGALELTVVDNGRGPAPRVDGRKRLGLGLTRDKVELVGGWVGFSGKPGKGSELIVRIPVRTVQPDPNVSRRPDLQVIITPEAARREAVRPVAAPADPQASEGAPPEAPPETTSEQEPVHTAKAGTATGGGTVRRIAN
ncbi:MAG: sensor histidine kinase [Actinomycetota bacterium]